MANGTYLIPSWITMKISTRGESCCLKLANHDIIHLCLAPSLSFMLHVSYLIVILKSIVFFAMNSKMSNYWFYLFKMKILFTNQGI